MRRVGYDAAGDLMRLPNCRTWYEGFPAWEILGYYSVDGAPASNVVMTQLQGNTRVAANPVIAVPAGHDLALWFYASDESGCLQWDSDYGRNFHFALVGAGR